MTHVRVWQFRPVPGREAEFAAAYSSDDVWARLFRQAEGFIGTSLLAPAEPGGPWLTLDRWATPSAFDRFQAEFGDAYQRLDAELAPLTAGELFIGAFDE
jgi:heme-degrading monooxygenase HmoA